MWAHPPLSLPPKALSGENSARQRLQVHARAMEQLCPELGAPALRAVQGAVAALQADDRTLFRDFLALTRCGGRGMFVSLPGWISDDIVHSTRLVDLGADSASHEAARAAREASEAAAFFAANDKAPTSLLEMRCGWRGGGRDAVVVCSQRLLASSGGATTATTSCLQLHARPRAAGPTALLRGFSSTLSA